MLCTIITAHINEVRQSLNNIYPSYSSKHQSNLVKSEIDLPSLMVFFLSRCSSQSICGYVISPLLLVQLFRVFSFLRCYLFVGFYPERVRVCVLALCGCELVIL